VSALRLPGIAASCRRTTPESVERGLVCLVLTIVELLRQLMERQSLRRVEDGTLTDDQIEKIGWTLMSLEERWPNSGTTSGSIPRISTSISARCCPSTRPGPPPGSGSARLSRG